MWGRRARTWKGVLRDKESHGTFKVVARSVKRVFELGARDGCEDGTKDVERRHACSCIESILRSEVLRCDRIARTVEIVKPRGIGMGHA